MALHQPLREVVALHTLSCELMPGPALALFALGRIYPGLVFRRTGIAFSLVHQFLILVGYTELRPPVRVTPTLLTGTHAAPLSIRSSLNRVISTALP